MTADVVPSRKMPLPVAASLVAVGGLVAVAPWVRILWFVPSSGRPVDELVAVAAGLCLLALLLRSPRGGGGRLAPAAAIGILLVVWAGVSAACSPHAPVAVRGLVDWGTRAGLFAGGWIVGRRMRDDPAWGTRWIAGAWIGFAALAVLYLVRTAILAGSIDPGDFLRTNAVGRAFHLNRNLAAAFFLFPAVAGLAFVVRPGSTSRGRGGAGGVAALAAAIVLLTGARASLVGLLAGGFVLLVLRCPGGRRRILLAAVALLLLGVGAGWGWMRVRERTDPTGWAIERHRFLYGTSAGFRLLVAPDAAALAVERPWTGHGPGTFGIALMARGPRALASSESGERVDHAHAWPLEWGGELGIVGLLLAAGFLVAIARSGLRTVSAGEGEGGGGTAGAATALLAALAALAVQGCFGIAFVLPLGSLLFAGGAGMLAGLAADDLYGIPLPRLPDGLPVALRVAGGAALVCLLVRVGPDAWVRTSAFRETVARPSGAEPSLREMRGLFRRRLAGADRFLAWPSLGRDDLAGRVVAQAALAEAHLGRHGHALERCASLPEGEAAAANLWRIEAHLHRASGAPARAHEAIRTEAARRPWDFRFHRDDRPDALPWAEVLGEMGDPKAWGEAARHAEGVAEAAVWDPELWRVTSALWFGARDLLRAREAAERGVALCRILLDRDPKEERTARVLSRIESYLARFDAVPR